MAAAACIHTLTTIGVPMILQFRGFMFHVVGAGPEGLGDGSPQWGPEEKPGRGLGTKSRRS